MAEDDTLKVHLTVPAAQAAPRIPLTLSKKVTPSSLRKQVSDATRIPVSSLRLIFRGRLIGDDDNKEAVTEFKLEEGCVLHCMGKPTQVDIEEQGSQQQPASSVTAQIRAGSTASIQANSTTVAASSTITNSLQEALTTLRSSNSPSVYLTAVTTLEKILSNISNNPMEEKYRKVKKQNAAFQRRLGGLAGGDLAMKNSGFVVDFDNGEEVYVMHATAEAWPSLMAAKSSVEEAVKDAKAAASQATAPPPTAAPVGNGGFPAFGSPGFGNITMGQQMQNAATSIMSDPNALSQMLQNPMVQQMMQNDPRFASNPMLRQSVEQLASNPAMVNQLSQMMRDPAMQSQLQSIMNSASMNGNMGSLANFDNMVNPGGMPMGGLGASASSVGNSTGSQFQSQQVEANNNGSASGGGSDEQMTEEEMIAEAIARSRQER